MSTPHPTSTPHMQQTSSTPPKDHLSDHEYDGIQEFDNPTPGWWHLIFIGSVVFSLFYYAFWEMSPLAPTPVSELAKQNLVKDRKIFGSVGDIKNNPEDLFNLMKNESLMRVAESKFAANCSQCHGPKGGGINGVNLTDDSYKNVKTITDLYTVITKGANNGAMPAWEATMSEKERVLMAAYTARLRGQKADNPKGPEGVPIPPWTEPKS
ncbi:MAG: cbb3-type cytochrome c oxidase N-terminal domain-containing protein [Phycisphaerales bacterium]|nr:MAG: c-type cytochrome [Phycisphaerales bacterium]